MTYVRIDGKEVMGLTEGERRSLKWLGRPPTWNDVNKILEGKLIGPIIHHTQTRSRCDACLTSVYDWSAEAKRDVTGYPVPTGRRFCRPCVAHRGGVSEYFRNQRQAGRPQP